MRHDIILKGWPSYIGLSVNPEESVELGTRELTTSPRMGKDKYGRVVDWKADKAFAPWIQPDRERLQVIERAYPSWRGRRSGYPLFRRSGRASQPKPPALRGTGTS